MAGGNSFESQFSSVSSSGLRSVSKNCETMDRSSFPVGHLFSPPQKIQTAFHTSGFQCREKYIGFNGHGSLTGPRLDRATRYSLASAGTLNDWFDNRRPRLSNSAAKSADRIRKSGIAGAPAER
jgi:hypothetical protein